MAQQLRVTDALEEDLSSVPSTSNRQLTTTCNLAAGDPAPSSDLSGYCGLYAHAHRYSQTHIIKKTR